MQVYFWTQFIKPSRTWILRKKGPWTFSKTEPYTKIHCFIQKRNFDKLGGADFKYGNICFKLPTENYLNKAFLVQNLCNLFSAKLCTSQIRGPWLQIWQCHFQISSQKYQNQVFLVANLCKIKQILGRWFQYDNSFLKGTLSQNLNLVFMA